MEARHMILTIAESLIDLAAILAGVGGIACLAYFIGLVAWEHRTERLRLREYRRERAGNAAGLTLESGPAHPRAVRRPTPRSRRPRSIQHHA
jgi:hypothetical protein